MLRYSSLFDIYPSSAYIASSEFWGKRVNCLRMKSVKDKSTIVLLRAEYELDSIRL